MESMNEIYQKYARSVYRFLYAKTRNKDIAEELTQETFYQAIKSIDKFDGSCKLSTWLFGIAKKDVKAYGKSEIALETLKWNYYTNVMRIKNESLSTLDTIYR